MKRNVEKVWIWASLLWLLITVGQSQAGLYIFGLNRVGNDYTNELYAMDATSGVVTQILGTYPDIQYHSLGGAVDAANGRLYKQITTKSDSTARLYAIDLRTGALLFSPTIDMGNTNRNLQQLYASDGVLYGFGVNYAGNYYTNELYAIDPTSGVVTQFLGAYPDIAYHSVGGAVDTANGRLYKQITTKSDSTARLYAIDLRTGALLFSPTIDMGNTNRNLQELFASDGALYGFGVNYAGNLYTNELYAMDPISGVATQVLGTYPDIYGHAPDATCVDPGSGRLYKYVVTKSDSTARLYTIDLRTGSLLYSPTIDMGNSNRSLQQLYAMPIISMPTGLSASDGTYTNKVRIIWSAVNGATSYEVWRAITNLTALATNLGETTGTSVDDTNTIAETVYYYWVKAKTATETSMFSSSDTGYRANLGSIQPDVKINGADGTVTIQRGEEMKVALFLMTSSGINADWWFVATALGGWYYYDAQAGTWQAFTDFATLHPSYQGPLFDFLAPVELLSINTGWLTPGVYVFYFAVDTNMDGILNDIFYYDSSTLNLVE